MIVPWLLTEGLYWQSAMAASASGTLQRFFAGQLLSNTVQATTGESLTRTNMLRRMPKRRRSDLSVQNHLLCCCTKFLLLHILLHKRPPNPPKTPQICVLLCAVSC